MEPTVKAVIIGDPHFRIDNMEEVDMFIERITLLVKKEKPAFVVCLGDLLHTHERLHTTVLNKAYEFVKKISSEFKMFVLVGNHDYIQNQQFLTQNHWMNGMKEWYNVVIVDTVIQYTTRNCKFVFVPYVPNGRFGDALDTTVDWQDATCIFAHQEFYGCKMGAIVSVDGDKWSTENPPVISGHIHSKQRPQTNIYYPGASIQTAFGESEDNTISVVSFKRNNRDYTSDEVDIGLPKKKIVYTDLETVETMTKVDKNIKLSVKGSDYNEFKAFKKTEKYKQLVGMGAKITFKLNQPQPQSYEKAQPQVDINFKQILYDIISGDNGLMEVYELVVNKTEVILL